MGTVAIRALPSAADLGVGGRRAIRFSADCRALFSDVEEKNEHNGSVPLNGGRVGKFYQL